MGIRLARLMVRLCTGLVVAGLMGGCGGGLVERVETLEPLPFAAADRPAPILLAAMRTDIRSSSIIGTYVGGMPCYGPYDDIPWGIGGSPLDDAGLADVFHDRMRQAGHDVVGDPHRLFGRSEDLARARYHVGARITALALELCREEGFLFGQTLGVSGEASMTVAWEVYSPLLRRVVYGTTTRGYAARSEPGLLGEDLLLQDAFASAVDNLAADAGFHETVLDAGAPQRLFGGARPAPEDLDTLALPPMLLGRAPPFDSPVLDHMEAVRAATVLIETGMGHGSGAMIAADGLVLTNAHVVGGAEEVRVTLLDGRVLFGQVLRRHRVRDVALVAVPGNGFAALPVRTAPAVIGETIYALGAPLAAALHGTVTAGVISAVRRNPLSGLPILQSDVTIHAGSSGGPLVDAHGNLIGIAVAGEARTFDPDVSIGLNYFIPIGDALAALNLRLGQPPSIAARG